METEELYQIQSKVEVETVVGYALSTGREVQFCLCLVIQFVKRHPLVNI